VLTVHEKLTASEVVIRSLRCRARAYNAGVRSSYGHETHSASASATSAFASAENSLRAARFVYHANPTPSKSPLPPIEIP